MASRGRWYYKNGGADLIFPSDSQSVTFGKSVAVGQSAIQSVTQSVISLASGGFLKNNSWSDQCEQRL